MKKIALAGVIFTVLSLVSCGGSTNYIPSNLVIPGNLQTQIAVPTYAQGSDELNAFNAINSFRGSIGLGYWNQNVYLDTAAANHINYSQNNGSFTQDIEVTGNPGFTGTTPSNRAIATGYYVLENTVSAKNIKTAVVGELYSSGTGANIIHDMVNTIYHRSGLMAQATVQVGFARDTGGVAPAGTHWWINHARLTTSQSVASNYVSHYPLDQSTGIPLSMSEEDPSVYSNQPGFKFATQTSSPVSVTTAAITNITALTFTITPAGSNTPLSGKIWNMANDPNLNTASYSAATANLTTPPVPVPTIPGYEVYWVGDAPFLPNTTYNVTFTGKSYLIPYALTNPVTLSWSFTTGAS